MVVTPKFYDIKYIYSIYYYYGCTCRPQCMGFATWLRVSLLGKTKMELMEKRAQKLELLRQCFDSNWKYDFNNDFARSSISLRTSKVDSTSYRQFMFD